MAVVLRKSLRWIEVIGEILLRGDGTARAKESSGKETQVAKGKRQG
jgi:hypothetical protein